MNSATPTRFSSHDSSAGAPLPRPAARSSSATWLSTLSCLTIPIALSQAGDWTEVQIGFVLLFMTAAMVLFTPIGGRLADRVGRRWPVVAGMSLMIVGMIILFVGQANAIVPLLLIGLGVAGTGLGISGPGQQTAALESVPAKEAGAAAGVYSTFALYWEYHRLQPAGGIARRCRRAER